MNTSQDVCFRDLSESLWRVNSPGVPRVSSPDVAVSHNLHTDITSNTRR